MHIEAANPDDRAALLQIASTTGLFTPEAAEALLGGILDQIHGGELGDGHTALVCRERASQRILGWTYLAPDTYADGVWNVWWIGVDPHAQGIGAGRALLRAAEGHAAQAGARLMIIETSSLAPQARARQFYALQGYAECGRVPAFYGEGDDKVIFARRPRAA